MEVAIIVVLILIIVVLLFALARTRTTLSERIEEVERETSTRVQEARRDAIGRSRAVLGGRFTEQMAPYLPEFRYDPTEARFIGSPVDLVVFPGLAGDEPQEIVFVEVKAGARPRLSAREQRVRELVEAGKVRWELLHRPSEPA